MSSSGANPEDVLRFWFGDLNEHGDADSDHRRRWFQKSDDFDRAIIEQFAAAYEAQCSGAHDDWLSSARGCLAYIIIFDQFARNMFRGDGRTHARDGEALKACYHGIKSGYLGQLAFAEQVFLLMPLMHAETVDDQEESVRQFAALVERSPAPLKSNAEGNHKYAIQHRDIVVRFGRFPHRNKLLGRETTEVEAEFLTTPGSSF